MCGRMKRLRTIESVAKEFNVLSSDIAEISSLSYDIFAKSKLQVVHSDSNRNKIEVVTLGFNTSWGKWPIINARSETVDMKPFFSKFLSSGRCVVPVQAFYERDEHKKNHVFSNKNNNIIYLAGLKNNKEELVILTTEPNKVVAPIHNRMPLILTRKNCTRWLSGDFQRANDLLEDVRLLRKAA